MKNTMKKLLALLLALVLTLALAACGQKEVALPVADGAVVGQGAVAFTVEVQGADGKTVTFTVNTDEETVGAALLKQYAGADDEKKKIIAEIFRRLAVDVKDELKKAAGEGLEGVKTVLTNLTKGEK